VTQPLRSSSSLALVRALLKQSDDSATAEALLREILQSTGAERGFVVVREGGQFVPRFEVRMDIDADDEHGRFSRAVVRRVLETNEPLYSENLADDSSVSHTESVIATLGRTVLVTPLSSGGEVFGALYLEQPNGAGMTPGARQLVAEVAELAGLALQRAAERTAFERRSKALETDLLAQFDFTGIIARDPTMLRLLRTVAQVAKAKAAILVRGESGTGKELIARALHLNSDRHRGPFVALHCAALPASMFESELFGHVRGGFTGADRDRKGRIASADEGTLFLDEVGELPLDVQAKLLRALQFGELQRVGSDKVERVDVRVVAATHRDLAQMVSKGAFREDLYYRLRVVELELPPLRSRRSDIALLANHFLHTHPGAAHKELSRAVVGRLEAYDWPGNVRELANVMERCALLSSADVIDSSDLPMELGGGDGASALRPPSSPAADSNEPIAFRSLRLADLEAERQRVVAEVEGRFARKLFALHDGSLQRAAEHSGLSRDELRRLAKAHGIPMIEVDPSELPSKEPGEPESLPAAVEQLERGRILAALELCAGNQTRAAEHLGISRRTLVARLGGYGITRPRKK
jgi:transcriptional regulator with GAF, ATPase, and Fis domain